MFPGADPGFQVIEGVLKIFGVFCVKNQNCRGCRVRPPLNPPLVPVVTTIVRSCY